MFLPFCKPRSTDPTRALWPWLPMGRPVPSPETRHRRLAPDSALKAFPSPLRRAGVSWPMVVLVWLRPGAIHRRRTTCRPVVDGHPTMERSADLPSSVPATSAPSTVRLRCSRSSVGVSTTDASCSMQLSDRTHLRGLRRLGDVVDSPSTTSPEHCEAEHVVRRRASSAADGPSDRARGSRRLRCRNRHPEGLRTPAPSDPHSRESPHRLHLLTKGPPPFDHRVVDPTCDRRVPADVDVTWGDVGRNRRRGAVRRQRVWAKVDVGDEC